MWSCDQSLVTVAFRWEKLQPRFYRDLTRKTAFFDGWSWFKFNNLGLELVMTLKFYINVAQGLKVKVRKFWGLIPTFVEVTGKKLVGGLFGLLLSWIGLKDFNFSEKTLRLDLKSCSFAVTRPTQLWSWRLKIFYWRTKSKKNSFESKKHFLR